MGWIEEANERPVPIDLFKELVGTLASLPRDGRSDFESRAFGMTQHLQAAKVEGDHAFIIMLVQLRMEALARLSNEPEYRAWSLNSDDGGDYIHEILVETAATQRLIELEDGRPSFEPRSFFHAALERSELDGRA